MSDPRLPDVSQAKPGASPEQNKPDHYDPDQAPISALAPIMATIPIGGVATTLGIMDAAAGITNDVGSAVFPPVAIAEGGLAAGILAGLSYRVHESWKDAEKVLDGIKPDLEHHATLGAVAREMYAHLGDKAGVTRNAKGEYAITDIGELHQAMIGRKAELEKTVADKDSILPTWMDMTNGQREDRSQHYLAEGALKRVTAAGVELDDLVYKQAAHSNPDAVKQHASAAAQGIQHLVQGGEHAHEAQAQAVGQSSKSTRSQTPS